MSSSALETCLTKIEADNRHCIATGNTYRFTLEAAFFARRGEKWNQR